MTPGGCLACDVLSGAVAPPGGVILDDGLWVVDHSTSPVVLAGFCIVKPRRHVEDLGSLTQQEASALGPLLKRVATAVTLALRPERIYVCSFGEAVRHIHWYVIPRYANMPAGGPDLIRAMFSPERPWATTDAEAAAVAAKVRDALHPG